MAGTVIAMAVNRGALKTAEGKTDIFIPQVRYTDVPFRSKLGAFLKGKGCVLKKLVLKMCARGLSAGDIKDAFFEATEDEVLFKTAVSEVTDILNDEFEAFQKKDLSSFRTEYLFLDAFCESIRRFSGSDKVIYVPGLRDERKGPHTSCGGQGVKLPGPALFNKGYGKEEVVHVDCDNLRWSALAHQGYKICLRFEPAHQVLVPQEQNLTEKSPLGSLTGCQERASRHKGGQRLSNRNTGISSPGWQPAFKRALKLSFNRLKLRYSHRKHVRTTNLIESSFVEDKIREDKD